MTQASGLARQRALDLRRSGLEMLHQGRKTHCAIWYAWGCIMVGSYPLFSLLARASWHAPVDAWRQQVPVHIHDRATVATAVALGQDLLGLALSHSHPEATRHIAPLAVATSVKLVTLASHATIRYGWPALATDAFGKTILVQRYITWAHGSALSLLALWLAAPNGSMKLKFLPSVLWCWLSLACAALVLASTGWLQAVLFMVSSSALFRVVHYVVTALQELAGGRQLRALIQQQCTVGRSLSILLVLCSSMVLVWCLATLKLVSLATEEGLLSALELFSQICFQHLLKALLEAADLQQQSATPQREAEVLQESPMQVQDAGLVVFAHSIQQPLAGLMGICQALVQGQCGPLGEAVHQQVVIMRGAIVRVLAMADSQQAMHASPRGGQTILMKEKVPLQQLVNEALGVIRGLTRAEVELRNTVPLEVTVLGNQPRIFQVLLELLTNAVRFTKRGVVRVSARSIARGSRVAITVSDTGIGIPRDKLASLFRKPHEQASHGPADEVRGLLGLSVAQDTVKALDGEIWAESVEGRGSVFTLTLPSGSDGGPLELVAGSRPAGSLQGSGPNQPPRQPRLPGQEPGESRSPSPAGAQAQGTQASSSYRGFFTSARQRRVESSAFTQTPGVHLLSAQSRNRIASVPGGLLAVRRPEPRRPFYSAYHGRFQVMSVDSDAVSHSLLRVLLGSVGYQLLSFVSGSQALTHLECCSVLPDCLLLDCVMPGLDGFQTLQRIRESMPHLHIPVILVSPKDDEAKIMRGVELGADDMLSKPYRRSELLARLQGQLGRATVSEPQGSVHPGQPFPLVTSSAAGALARSASGASPMPAPGALSSLQGSSPDLLLQGSGAGHARAAPRLQWRPLGRPPLIVCVDYDSDSQALMESVVNSQGFWYHLCSSTAQVLDFLRTTTVRPHLVLLSCVLPDCSYVETCNQIRALLPKGQVHIVLLAAQGSERAIAESLDRAGADGYILKPLRRGELLARIRLHLQLQDAPPGVAPSDLLPATATAVHRAAGGYGASAAAALLARTPPESIVSPVGTVLHGVPDPTQGPASTWPQLPTPVLSVTASAAAAGLAIPAMMSAPEKRSAGNETAEKRASPRGGNPPESFTPLVTIPDPLTAFKQWGSGYPSEAASSSVRRSMSIDLVLEAMLSVSTASQSGHAMLSQEELAAVKARAAIHAPFIPQSLDRSSQASSARQASVGRDSAAGTDVTFALPSLSVRSGIAQALASPRVASLIKSLQSSQEGAEHALAGSSSQQGQRSTAPAPSRFPPAPAQEDDWSFPARRRNVRPDLLTPAPVVSHLAAPQTARAVAEPTSGSAAPLPLSRGRPTAEPGGNTSSLNNSQHSGKSRQSSGDRSTYRPSGDRVIQVVKRLVSRSWSWRSLSSSRLSGDKPVHALGPHGVRSPAARAATSTSSSSRSSLPHSERAVQPSTSGERVGRPSTSSGNGGNPAKPPTVPAGVRPVEEPQMQSFHSSVTAASVQPRQPHDAELRNSQRGQANITAVDGPPVGHGSSASSAALTAPMMQPEAGSVGEPSSRVQPSQPSLSQNKVERMRSSGTLQRGTSGDSSSGSRATDSVKKGVRRLLSGLSFKSKRKDK